MRLRGASGVLAPESPGVNNVPGTLPRVWWTAASDHEGRVSVGRKASIDDELAALGLAEADGLWTDQARTVGVARSTAGLLIGWIDVGWVSDDEPFAELRDVAHLPPRPCGDELARDLRIAVAEALSVRTERLRECGSCGERFVPGQMHGSACCQGCAPRG